MPIGGTNSIPQVSLHASESATGNGGFVDCEGIGAVGVDITNSGGTFTVAFEGTIDDTNWRAIRALQVSDATVVTTTSTTGAYIVGVAGFKQFRARISAASGCSVSIKAMLYPGSLDSMLAALSGGAITVSTGWGVNDVSATASSITYVGKEKADGSWWLLKIDTSSGTAIGHATVKNNAAYTTYTAAYTARASLTYGDYQDAF